MKFDFYMTLPSNSSMTYFPENTTTNFTTRLSREWKFSGDWMVGLTEIQFPQTFSHIPLEGSKNYVGFWNYIKDGNDQGHFTEERVAIKSGVYQNIHTLLNEVSNASNVAGHLKFELDVGGHVTVKRICGEKCLNAEHRFSLSNVLRKIMGFDEIGREYRLLDSNNETRSQHPAALTNALPDVMFVYTDICESHVTGDVQTPLLRVVPTELHKYEYGCMKLRTFSPAKYFPLLKSSFDTIEIDIRNQIGERIAFDHGTLTVTLHFKRID